MWSFVCITCTSACRRFKTLFHCNMFWNPNSISSLYLSTPIMSLELGGGVVVLCEIINHDGSYVYSGLAKTVVSTMSCIVIRLLFMSRLSGSLYYIIIYISAADWHAIYVCTHLYRYSLIHWLSLRGIPKTYVLSSILVVDQMMYMVVHKFLPRKPPVCKTLIVSVGSMHEYVLHKNVEISKWSPFSFLLGYFYDDLDGGTFGTIKRGVNRPLSNFSFKFVSKFVAEDSTSTGYLVQVHPESVGETYSSRSVHAWR